MNLCIGGFTDSRVSKHYVSIWVTFDPACSPEVAVCRSGNRLCPAAAKIGLNPVSAAVHQAEKSPSEILKPCPLQLPLCESNKESVKDQE